MAQPDVLLGYLHGINVDSAFMDSVLTALTKDKFRRIEGVASIESGPYITDGRNALAQTFLQTRCKWLLMLDADMAFPPDIVPRLLKHATPNRVVGGLCYSYNGRTRDALPVMFDAETGARITAWEPGALVPVGFVGGACLMIHRNVFERTPAPWFRNVDLPNGRHMDQDQVFCMNLRHAGFQLAVDTSTVIGHAKRILVDSRDYNMPQRTI